MSQILSKEALLTKPSQESFKDCKLIFEHNTPGVSGVDIEDCTLTEFRLGAYQPRAQIGLPDIAEPTLVRHYTRLSQKNYAIDTHMYPLGSCTMKYNPRLNERVSRFQGLSKLHPLQSPDMIQGALELMHSLQTWILSLTGMEGIALSPAAGAQGELCGMMAIRAALKAGKQTHRKIVLVPDSAHGTNPSTAVACGFQTISLKSDETGQVDLTDFQAKIDEHHQNLAGIMLTNPNTCGVFEKNIQKIAEQIHQAGGYFYCDGANFNAIMGQIRPGDLGIDAMHLNLHKTFSTPHGGGGPGAGPVVFSKALAPYAPIPQVKKTTQGFALIESQKIADAPGRLKGFHGQFGMFIRAYAYMISLGIDGIRQASADAVLNANYIKENLKDLYTIPFSGDSMHEVLFDETSLSPFNVTTLDIAKALIDYGFHPMTIYFPLVVKGAMLIEPTETESKENLDRFITAMREIYDLAKTQGPEAFKNRPYSTDLQKLDEAKAAREPKLVY